MVRFLKVSLGILFITFIVVYAISESGYYEYQLASKKNLTEEQIKRFEQDVKEGKDIDLSDYMTSDKVDYSNNLSRTTFKLSNKLNDVLKGGIETFFKFANKLVED